MPLPTIKHYYCCITCGKYQLTGDLNDWYSEEDISKALNPNKNYKIGDQVTFQGGQLKITAIINK